MDAQLRLAHLLAVRADFESNEKARAESAEILNRLASDPSTPREQLADVLIELRGRPRVVRIRRSAIPQLMPANRVIGSGSEVQRREQPNAATTACEAAQDYKRRAANSTGPAQVQLLKMAEKKESECRAQGKGG